MVLSVDQELVEEVRVERHMLEHVLAHHTMIHRVPGSKRESEDGVRAE